MCDSRWALHSGRENTTRRTGTEARGRGWGWVWCPGEERGRGRCVTSEEVRLDRPASETGRLCGRPHASRGAALLELGGPLRGRGGGGARIAPGIRIHFGFVRSTVKISRGAGHVPIPPTSTPPSSPRLPPPPIHAFPHPRRRPTAPILPDGATRPAPALPDAQPHRAAPPDAQPHRAAPPPDEVRMVSYGLRGTRYGTLGVGTTACRHRIEEMEEGLLVDP